MDRAGVLGRDALVGVEAQHPVVARLLDRELLLPPEAQPLLLHHARALSRRELWRAALWKPSVWSEMGAWRRELRGERYDAVVDTQSLVKSALLSALALGTRHGMDPASARERLAARFYDVCHAVPRGLHAVERNRRLASSALGFSLDNAVDYGLRAPPGEK